jgi:capsular exopolysaccharide synthesis family protein
MDEHDGLAPVERVSLETAAPRTRTIIDSGPEGSEGFSYLRAYWLIILKRRWAVLAAMVVVVTLVAIISFRTKPVYEAAATVEVEAETPQIQSLADLYRGAPGWTDETFLQTQVDVLQSETLTSRTFEQLGVAEQAPNSAAAGGAGQAESPAKRQERILAAWRSTISARLMRDSRIIEVIVDSGDPQFAARAANAHVANYVDYNFHQKYDATRQASAFMEQQLDELKAKVEKSQQAMVDYEREHAIVDIGEKQNVVEQRLGSLSQDLTSAQSDRMQKQSLYELANSKDSQAALVAQDELIQHLEEKLADLKGQYVEALDQYGTNFPKVVRLRSQVSEIQANIDRERNRVLTRLRNDYQAALAREKLLNAAVTQEKVEVGQLNQLLIQHNMLKHEFETNQQLYESLLQHLKDATVSAGLRATNIHVVDSAQVPTVPIRPRIVYNIAVSLLVGLVLGVTLAFVMESMDSSIKSPEDVERVVGLPSLAVIPRARSSWLSLGDRRSRDKHEAVESIVLRQPSSFLSEAYRVLRTAVLLSTSPRPPQTLLVTSASPGEGKTCTSVNLAVGLAQRGVRVVIVDTDMRRQGVPRALNLTGNGSGLSTLLAGTHSLDEVLSPYEAVPNLWVIQAGPKPPNPADLLSSPAMEKLVHDLRGRFDHVVLDSTPLLLVTDATIISRLADGVLLVVESGVTNRRGLVRAQKILESTGTRILGTVLNKWDARAEGYYAYYGSYYRGYYDRHSYYKDKYS